MWTLRLLFEFLSHNKACFITLTYDDDNLPYNIHGEYQLCKKDVQDFMKRLRKYFTGTEIRFYCAGEYGSRRKRPHYHLILFGIDFSDYGLNVNCRSELLSKLWTFGLNHVGQCNPYTIQYVAGYVLKKFVNKKRDTITPEFTLMSRRPGIGFFSINSYEQLMANNPSFSNFVSAVDIIPSTVVFGGKTYPLDRYFKSKLYDALGIDPDTKFREFVDKTIARQKEAIDQGYYNLIEYEISSDEQARKNRIAKLNSFTKSRGDL